MSIKLLLIFLAFICPFLIYGQNDVKIGNQIWTSKNLNVRNFRNGDRIPLAESKGEWIQAGYDQIPACCYYGFDSKNGSEAGLLYNWYAVNDPRGLAPKGYHIPDDNEWKTLINYLGGEYKAGKKLKSKSIWPGVSNDGKKECSYCKDWSSEYKSKRACDVCFDNRYVKVPEVITKYEDNSSGFSALPTGSMYFGNFNGYYNSAIWWTSSDSENYPNIASTYSVRNGSESTLWFTDAKGYGHAIRCVKDLNEVNDNKPKTKKNSFLEENAKKPGIKTTKSGLQYKIIKETKGPKPNQNSVVKVNYTAQLTNGDTVFASQQGSPSELELSKMVDGFQEGVQLMSKGSKYFLFIPSELGYGEDGVTDVVGPNETLLVEVELVDF